MISRDVKVYYVYDSFGKNQSMSVLLALAPMLKKLDTLTLGVH